MKASYKFYLTLTLAAFAACFSASAQDFQTGYFLGGYNHAFRLNPAFQNERSHFSLVTGDIGLGARTDMGLSTFLFPKDGRLVTALNPEVSSEEFLSQFTGDMNPLAVYANIDLLTLGFWAKHSYITIDARVRTDVETIFPTSLFEFLKDGTKYKNEFDLSGLSANADAFLELSLGFSHRMFADKLSIGGRVKYLSGLAHANVNMEKTYLKMAEDQWVIEAQGALDLSFEALDGVVDKDGYYDYEAMGVSFDAANLASPAGIGGAVDLGVSFDIFPWLTASAAVLDLGVIQWNSNIYGLTPTAVYTWEPTGRYIDLLDPDSIDQFSDDEMDRLEDAFENLYRFKPAEAKEESTKLPMRVNAGVELRLPFYDRLSLGALYSMKNSDLYKWNEVRLSLNWSPAEWLSFSGSTAMSNIGESFGAAFNFHPRSLNIFVGADFIPKRIAAIPGIGKDLPNFVGIPIEQLNANIYLGISLAIGKARLNHARHYIWSAGVEEKDEYQDAFPLEDIVTPQEDATPGFVPVTDEPQPAEGEQVVVAES